MRLVFSARLSVAVCFMLFLISTTLRADIHGLITDPSGAPVAGAQVYLLGGPARTAVTDSTGQYRFKDIAKGHYTIVAGATGLAGKPVTLDYSGSDQTMNVPLTIAAVAETVSVTAQRTELPAASVAESTTVITRADIEAMHAENAEEALRLAPGLVVSQTLDRGNVGSIFARGANSNMNLVLVDGVQVNDFGGVYNFANLPAENIERIEIVRGPQSALYGSNAVGAVIQIITRHNDGGAQLHGAVEGGTFGYVKGSVGAGVTLGKFSVDAEAMHLSSDGSVPNGDYRNEDASLKASYDVTANSRFTYAMSADADESGAPGPYGSNPIHAYSGLDLISRSKENAYRHAFRYDFVAGKVHQQFNGALHDEIYYYASPYGTSKTTNRRGDFSSQTEIALRPNDSLVAGFEYQHESTTNSFLTDPKGNIFPVLRNELGYFVENRYQYAGRFFLNAGFRFEDVRTDAMPAVLYGGPARAATQVFSPNPKLSAAWLPRAGGSTRLHGSVGTGLRAPNGFELAFTNNPNLKPERTTSFDIGVEQNAWGRRVTLDATYFYNRFHDLIVTLGSTQAGLSQWQSDNLSNARSQGLELSGAFRPTRSLRIAGHYTYNPTDVLPLDGSSQAPTPFLLGQELIRRPAHNAAYDITWNHQRLTLSTSAFFRSSVLDVEPSYGAGGGIFTNPGYVRADAGVEFALSRALAIYGRLRNLNDARYEEVYGYPSERRNFFVGMKFNLSRK
jgi:outer membrane cobalamin receptor